jgi:hypothetical protein
VFNRLFLANPTPISSVTQAAGPNAAATTTRNAAGQLNGARER